ncbi:hypothetical protein EBX31_07245 [bacterium]|nr:hypothetical protein [bacterium]
MITIRFIRDLNKTDGSTDDMANIGVIPHDMVGIFLHEGGVKSYFELSEDVLCERWLPMIFDTLECDDDPYAAIQLDQPFAPSVIVSVKSIPAKRSRLISIFLFAIQQSRQVNSNRRLQSHPPPPPAEQPSPLGLPSDLRSTIHLRDPSPIRPLTSPFHEEEQDAPVAAGGVTTDDAAV